MTDRPALPSGYFHSNQESLELNCEASLKSLKDEVTQSDPILHACERLNTINILNNPEEFMQDYNYIAAHNKGKYDDILASISKKAYEQAFVALYNEDLVDTLQEAIEYIASDENGVLLTSRPFRPGEFDSVKEFRDVEIDANDLLSSLFQDLPAELYSKIMKPIRVYYVNRTDEYPGGRGGLNEQGVPFVVHQPDIDNDIVLWNEVAHVIFNRLLAEYKIYDVSRNSKAILIDGERVILILISEYLSDISSYGYSEEMLGNVLHRDDSMQLSYMFSRERFGLAARLPMVEQRDFLINDFKEILRKLIQSLESK